MFILLPMVAYNRTLQGCLADKRQLTSSIISTFNGFNTFVLSLLPSCNVSPYALGGNRCLQLLSHHHWARDFISLLFAQNSFDYSEGKEQRSARSGRFISI